MSVSKQTHIHVQTEDFDLNIEYAALRKDCPAIGAITTFTGLMRDFNSNGHSASESHSANEYDSVTTLTLEHYPGMTEKVLSDIVEQARARWELVGVRIVHRIGEMQPSDQIVFVGVSSAHRGDAFAACEFIMDFLKTQAPFWKKEKTTEGERWVDAKTSDDDSADRWL